MLGLEVTGRGGVRRFLPWVAARVEGGVVRAPTPLVLMDEGESYLLRGARLLRGPLAAEAREAGAAPGARSG
ncbi:MAG TPA: hypothetical protein VNJ46_07830 [Gaiellaceae bacterium]|nr:hypothetical protein [Gaiellaceae bacterium]